MGFSMKFKYGTTWTLTQSQQSALGHQRSWFGTEPWLWSRSIKRTEEGQICACMWGLAQGSNVCLSEEVCSNNLKLQSWMVHGGCCSLVLVLQQFMSKPLTWRWKMHHSVHQLYKFRASVCLCRVESGKAAQPAAIQFRTVLNTVAL